MTQKERWKKALWLYLYFAKVGCYTFGGGWSIIAQMQKDFVAKRGWTTDEELLDKYYNAEASSERFGGTV